jgi:hypothetical protein
MRRFVKMSFYFIATGLLLAYALQWIIDAGLKKSGYAKAYKEWYDIENGKVKSDILILGSSRAKRQISPKDFEEAFAMPAYNLGIDGGAFNVQSFLFEEYLEHNPKPKYIIQIIDIDVFSNPQVKFDYQQFVPYLNNNFIEKVGTNSVFNYADFYLPLYKYIHLKGAVPAGLKSFFNSGPPSNKKYKGFASVNKSYSGDYLATTIKESPGGIKGHVTADQYSQFIAFIKFCQKENIKLILVYGPVLNQYQNRVINKQAIINTYKQTVKQYRLPYFDYSNDQICADTSMFYDFNHLNSKGVAIYNKKLISDLKTIIK